MTDSLTATITTRRAALALHAATLRLVRACEWSSDPAYRERCREEWRLATDALHAAIERADDEYARTPEPTRRAG